MSTMTKFDFTAFNAMVGSVAPGLKIALAETLIKDAVYAMERFHNPLTDDLYGIGNELKVFRIKYKEAAAARTAARAEISAPAVDQRPVTTDVMQPGTSLDKDGNPIV